MRKVKEAKRKGKVRVDDVDFDVHAGLVARPFVRHVVREIRHRGCYVHARLLAAQRQRLSPNQRAIPETEKYRLEKKMSVIYREQEEEELPSVQDFSVLSWEGTRGLKQSM
jgi:hypothetical protein